MFKVQSIRIFAASILATTLVGSAVADMVYDDENTMSAAPTKVEVKNVINAASAPAPIAATETATTPPVIVETQKIQKQSEKAREKRGFQESVNNELVIQKLEDKRLKQEEKLTAEINKRFTLEDETSAGTPAPVMKEEKIVKPITEAPGSALNEMSAAPKGEATIAKPIAQDQIASYQSSTSMSAAPVMGKPDGEKASKNGVSIIPKAGLSTISTTGMNISPKFMTGVGIGFEASDYVGVEIGYSYSENGVRLDSTNTGGYYGYQTTNQLTFKNNTFDIALKLYASSTDSKVRPYIGGGGAYSMGYINYDQQQQQAYGYYYGAANNSSDYQLKQFQGMAEAGLDIKLASNISLGAAFKFYKPLSSTESEEGLQYGYFYSQPYTMVDPNKQALRGTIRDSNTSVFQVSASVSF